MPKIISKPAAKKPSKPVVQQELNASLAEVIVPATGRGLKAAPDTSPTAAAAAKAAVTAGRNNTAVLQQSPGVFYLGSKRRGVTNGAIFMGRAGALHKTV